MTPNPLDPFDLFAAFSVTPSYAAPARPPASAVLTAQLVADVVNERGQFKATVRVAEDGGATIELRPR